jgi:hypothetical protein
MTMTVVPASSGCSLLSYWGDPIEDGVIAPGFSKVPVIAWAIDPADAAMDWSVTPISSNGPADDPLSDRENEPDILNWAVLQPDGVVTCDGRTWANLEEWLENQRNCQRNRDAAIERLMKEAAAKKLEREAVRRVKRAAA